MNERKLKELMEYKSGSVRAFANDIDIPYTTIRSILERGVLNAKAENIFKICSALNIKPEAFTDLLPSTPTQPQNELVTAITDKVVRLTTPRQEHVLEVATGQLEEQKREERAESIIEEDNIIRFAYDYYDHAVSAGTGQYLSDVAVETIELPIDVNADFVVPVQGSSMQPDYNDGDYAFIKLSYNLSDGDIGVFYYNGDAYIKQLCIDGKKAYLHSLNPAYPDMPITEDIDFRIIGEVVEKYREG